jgi:hypothetical protein
MGMLMEHATQLKNHAVETTHGWLTPRTMIPKALALSESETRPEAYTQENHDACGCRIAMQRPQTIDAT